MIEPLARLMKNALASAVAWTAWPVLLGLCVLATEIGFRLERPDLAFYLTYCLLMAATLALQGWMPHERSWLERDGQLRQDLTHSLVSTGAVQGMVQFTGMIGLSFGFSLLGGPGLDLWPTDWPMALQVVLGLVLLEFTSYWAHRLAHEWRPLWYFHAIHHSVERLSVINNGRFHFIDAVKTALPGIVLLLAMRTPLDVMTWVSALSGYIGLLTHCNVAMRFGPLSLVFNTPELHRWHHSKDISEGNRNYGESLMLWDLLFGTWFNADRRPPVDIGIPEMMPPRFRDQILWPFHRLVQRT